MYSRSSFLHRFRFHHNEWLVVLCVRWRRVLVQGQDAVLRRKNSKTNEAFLLVSTDSEYCLFTAGLYRSYFLLFGHKFLWPKESICYFVCHTRWEHRESFRIAFSLKTFSTTIEWYRQRWSEFQKKDQDELCLEIDLHKSMTWAISFLTSILGLCAFVKVVNVIIDHTLSFEESNEEVAHHP